MGLRTPDDAARGIVYLCTAEECKDSDGYYVDGTKIDVKEDSSSDLKNIPLAKSLYDNCHALLTQRDDNVGGDIIQTTFV